jgi:hypothetical protein
MANIYLNAKVDLTTTNLTTLYTCPSNSRAIVKSLLVTEDANSGTTIDITLVNASSAIFNIAKTRSISAKATEQVLTEPLILMESEVLKVQAADANELFVIASILEMNRDDN